METTVRSTRTTRTSRSDTSVLTPFRRVAVIGAGTMGSQIAAHLANAGVSVLLLDVPADEPDPNAIVRKGLERARKLKPNPFFSDAVAERVRIGNLSRDLDQLRDREWIIEAVVERKDVKETVFQQIAEFLSPEAVLSTNTSGIPVAKLAATLPDHLVPRFLGTHFFNPPRYLRLLECIPTDRTDAGVVERLKGFARVHLGKGVVVANDSPYFIGNRIGVYAMVRAMQYVLEGSYTIEEVDLLTGPLIGRPRSATFRTADVVGLDVLLDVLTGMHERLTDDESRARFRPPDLLTGMVEQGALGAKVGAGFYRKTENGLLRIDPQSGDYMPVQQPQVEVDRLTAIQPLAERLRALYEENGRGGRFFRETTWDLLAYSARRLPEIARSPDDVDRALRWGFGWEMGPFEVWDALGFERVYLDMRGADIPLPDWIERVAADHRAIYRTDAEAAASFIPELGRYEAAAPATDVLALAEIRSEASATIWQNDEAALLDVGEGVALFEFRSKGNTMSQAVMHGLLEALDVVDRDRSLRGMVIGNEGKNFSVGANLAEMAFAAMRGDFEAIGTYLQRFQKAIQRVRYAAKPIVVAAHQRVLGGACELLMGCRYPVLSAETYSGLVEVGVGLIPAGTGLTRLAAFAADRSPTRHPSHIQPFLQKYFEQVARASVSTSALEAVEMGYASTEAVLVMHDDRRLYAAREQVVRLSAMGYRPLSMDGMIRVLGRSARAALEVGVDQFRQGGFMSDYDAHIAQQVAYVLTGGDLTTPQDVHEQYLLDLEREVFLRLLGEQRTQERIKYMLENKKPLRN